MVFRTYQLMETRREIYCHSLCQCTTRPQINVCYKGGADYEFSEAEIEMVHLIRNIVEFAFLLTFDFEKKSHWMLHTKKAIAF